MNGFKVVEKNDHNAVHLITWSKERGEMWIEKYGDSGAFTDKSLTKESFEVIENK
jgi:hypothetical protein